MGSPIAALVARYDAEIRWLRELDHLGLPHAQKGVLPASLPDGYVGEIKTQTKNRRAIGVLIDGAPRVIAAPASYPTMLRITREFVHAGGYPDDLLVWDYDPIQDKITAIRTATDHLLWTASDQIDLERSAALRTPE